jgi:hypothetical protein
MNRSAVGRWARRAVWAALFVVAAIGCSPLSVVGFMFGQKEKVPAAYPLTLGKDSPNKDKDEVVVLLLTHVAPGAASQTFFNADRDLASELARVLPEMAKANKDKKKVRAVSPTQVDKFKTANPTTWKGMNPAKIGQELKADFVLDIEMSKLQLYQPHTGQEIYEGRAEVTVTIYEVGSDKGPRDYSLTFSYPHDMIARSSSSMSESEFKKGYIAGLAVEIAEHHIDHMPRDTVAGGR